MSTTLAPTPADTISPESEMRTRAPVIDPSLLKAAGQAAQDGGSLASDAEKPLVFKYSESQATGIWLNKTRMLGFSRLAATAAQYKAGMDIRSPWRKASALMGLFSNISYFIWGHAATGRERSLDISHGNWALEGDRMVHSMPGKISKAGLLQLEDIFEAAELTSNSVKVDFDSKRDRTTISVRAQDFDLIQQSMKRLLGFRVEAINVLQDQNRIRLSRDSAEIQSINLQDLQEGTVNALKRLVVSEWNIPVSISTRADGRWLDIPAPYRTRFMEERNPDLARSAHKIKVRTLQEQPGNFWDAIAHPGKYPVQFGTLIGGISSNVLRLVAAVTEIGEIHEKDGVTKVKIPQASDMIGTVISQLAYIIETQREITQERRASPVIEGLESRKKSKIEKLYEDFSNNPMVASIPLKMATLYMRTSYVRDLPDDYKGKDYLAISTFFDFVTAGISVTTKKTDYGR